MHSLVNTDTESIQEQHLQPPTVTPSPPELESQYRQDIGLGHSRSERQSLPVQTV